MRLRDLSKRTFTSEVELGYNKSESKKESSSVIYVTINLRLIMTCVYCATSAYW